MKMNILCAIPLVAVLAGCDPAQLAELQSTGYQVTVQDAGSFVIENHERRKSLRQKLYAMQDAVIDECVQRAREANFMDQVEQALATLDWCQEYVKGAYPDLATIQALREGHKLVDELKTYTPPTDKEAEGE